MIINSVKSTFSFCLKKNLTSFLQSFKLDISNKAVTIKLCSVYKKQDFENCPVVPAKNAREGVGSI